jgi:hypothetical protein
MVGLGMVMLSSSMSLLKTSEMASMEDFYYILLAEFQYLIISISSISFIVGLRGKRAASSLIGRMCCILGILEYFGCFRWGLLRVNLWRRMQPLLPSFLGIANRSSGRSRSVI